jgi:hypothetical protein
MKLLRIATIAAMIAFGGIAGGASVVHATPATGAPAVKTLQTPALGELPLEKTYYYYRRHYYHPYYHRYYRRYYHPYYHPYWHRRYYRPYWHRRYWHPYW